MSQQPSEQPRMFHQPPWLPLSYSSLSFNEMSSSPTPMITIHEDVLVLTLSLVILKLTFLMEQSLIATLYKLR